MMDQQEEGLSVLPATRSVENIMYCGVVTEVNLLAGQHIVAGTVVVGKRCVASLRHRRVPPFLLMNPAILAMSSKGISSSAFSNNDLACLMR